MSSPDVSCDSLSDYDITSESVISTNSPELSILLCPEKYKSADSSSYVALAFCFCLFRRESRARAKHVGGN